MLLVGIPLSIADSAIFPDKEKTFDGFLQFLMFYYGTDTNHFVVSIVIWIGTVLIAIFLVRRWSKQWNLKFETTQS